MKYKRPSEVIRKEVKVEKETISKKPIEEKKLCNGCKNELPKILDRGLCPFCGVRN